MFEANGLPVVPTGYRILVRVPKVAEQTPAGVHLPQGVRKLEESASIIGEVIALGPLAYKDAEKFPTGAWCGLGDFIVMRAYSGTKFKFGEADYRLINDDTVEGVTTKPDEIERAV